MDELRTLLMRLIGKLGLLLPFSADAAIPWTNNVSEQMIARIKMRARTVRGYKSWSGMEAGMLPAGYLHGSSS